MLAQSEEKKQNFKRIFSFMERLPSGGCNVDSSTTISPSRVVIGISERGQSPGREGISGGVTT